MAQISQAKKQKEIDKARSDLLATQIINACVTEKKLDLKMKLRAIRKATQFVKSMK